MKEYKLKFDLFPHSIFWLTLLICTHYIKATEKQSIYMMSPLSDQYKEQFASNAVHFALDVYKLLRHDRPSENIVFSPLSLQTCMAMARIGAEGRTAEELNRGLRLVSTDVAIIAETFNTLLAKYADSDILKMANRIYVMEGFHINERFQNIANEKFLSGAEEIDFGNSAEAATKMNDWVKFKTNNLITDLIPASALNSNTRLVLLNAIHFKGQWLHKFPKENTRDDDFYLNESDKVKVAMMSVKQRFLYANLPELDARALELRYDNSDLSMLIILPNSRTGLKSLEEKLKDMPLSEIKDKMYSREVALKLPKFKAEFSVELSEPMRKLGMSRMLSDNAEFGKMLQEKVGVRVSKIVHKAFIDVNEEGTEAAAATGMFMFLSSMPSMPEVPIIFEANKPFFYIIRNADGITIFVGNTLNIK